MGIYTVGTNRITGYEELPVAEGYNGEAGAYIMTIENIKNDMALFEAVITSDFQETATAMNESASEEDLISLMEAAGSGFIEKIKQFLKKAWEKIKGLLNSFWTRLMTVVIRDNKKLVEKYRSTVMKKDLSKFKYKWADMKSDKNAVFGSSVEQLDAKFKTISQQVGEMGDLNGSKFESYVKEGSSKDIDDKITKLKTSENKESILSKAFGGTIGYDTAYKDAVELNYNDSEEHVGLSDALKINIMNALVESKDVINAFKKAESDANKIYNDRLKTIDLLSNKVSKLAPSGGNIDYKDSQGNTQSHKATASQGAAISKYLNYLYTGCNVEQELYTKCIGIATKMYKWKISECRSVFSRAAAYNEKAVKEDAELMQGIDDEAFHAIEESFEGIYAY